MMKPALKRLIGVSTSLIFFIGSIVVFTGFIVPTATEVQELRGRRDALSTLLEEESARIETVRNLFQEFGSVSTLKNTLARALPVGEEIPSLINQLHGIAKVSGVAIDSLDISLPAIKQTQKSAVEPLGEVQVSFNLTGNYASIKSYIQAIETNVRIMDVERIGIQGGTEDTILKYNIVVKAYYQL